MNRTLSRRLERLEGRMLPVGNPKIIHVTYVNPDGTQAPGAYSVVVPESARA